MTRRSQSGDAGFTLIETLLATALLLLVLAMLAAVTAQWLPTWNRGFHRAQANERLALGLERIVADLAAAEFILSAGEPKRPMFDGTTLSVTFVRTAIGPNSRRGLEVVRLAEVADDRGPVLVRATAPFVPSLAEGDIAQLRLTDPNVLVRPPYRVQFSFADADRQWLSVWRGANRLPSAIRIAIRNGATGQLLEVSTAARLHVNAPADCAKERGACPDLAQAALSRPPGSP